jgi:hypothetical protein
MAGAQPQPNGFIWLLARIHGATSLQEFNLTTGNVALIVPTSADSVALSQSPTGLIGIGTATSTTGTLELRNGASGAKVANVPVGAPVKAVTAGADGTTFYVLDGSPTSASVSLVNGQTDQVSETVPVPLDTVAITVDPGGHSLFALLAGGRVDQILLGTGAVTANFPVGSNPRQLALSNTGSTLYVLKSNDGRSASNVGVVDLATESQTMALPAPANSVGLQLSPDGQSLYLLVGTPVVGNIQQFALHP